MDLSPTPERRRTRETVAAFADGEVAPRAADVGATDEFPADLVAEVGELGLMGVPFSEAYDGAGLDGGRHPNRRVFTAAAVGLPMDGTTASANGVRARYVETDAERRLVFEPGDDSAAVAVVQNRDGYAMLMVRVGGPDGDEVERYYGLDVALDHAAELLGAPPRDLPVPDAARDMGM